MTIITLTSDFGMRDPYVGIMKGVILGIAPLARLVDLSHEIPPQSIDVAAYTLRSAVPYFPAGTIHLAVIDPGVGSARRPLLVSTGRAFFVGPDNGLFSFALDEPGSQARVLDRELYWLPKISRTFHGRDVFAPVAAHLAAGLSPSKLGTIIHDPVRYLRREPARGPGGEIRGHIIHVDRFGNLISDIPAPWLRGAGWICEIAGHRVSGPSESYAAAQPGELVLLISSGDTAEIAVRQGNAAERLGIGSGAPLILRTI